MSKKQVIGGLSLPPELAEERAAEQQAQMQLMAMRNGLAAEIFTNSVSPTIKADYETVANSQDRDIDIAAISASSLKAAMIFLEVAGVIKSRDGGAH